MKTQLVRLPAALLLSFIFHLSSFILLAHAQGTAFTYQGRLFDNGNPANGNYNLRLWLYDTNANGNVVAGPLTNAPVTVSNGLFTVLLDFGSGVFTGPARWLQIDVSSNSVPPTYVPLTTRQQLTPAPYAIYSENAASANSVTTPGAPAAGQVLSFNGTSLVWTNPSGASSGWSLTGNDGAGALLGTTNNQALNFIVNGGLAGTLYPIPGGTPDVAWGNFNFFAVGGSGGNVIAGGGWSGGHNYIYSSFSSIGGGYDNRIDPSSPESVIAGGPGHRISGAGAAAIGGGAYNTISNAQDGVIPGGLNNLVSGDYGFAAGNAAQAVNPGSFVWADNSTGGAPFASTSNNQFSVRAWGGVRFETHGAGMTLDGVQVGAGGGGSGWSLTGNTNTSPGSNFLGTLDNQPLELWVSDARALRLEPDNSSGYVSPNLIAGSPANTVGAGEWGSTIAGGGAIGWPNILNASFGAIGGGEQNSIQNFAEYSTISGGFDNTIQSYDNYSSIGGGNGNTIQSDYISQLNFNGFYSVIGGGSLNTIRSNTPYSTIGGGLHNTVASGAAYFAGEYAFIGGGISNVTSGTGATVAGGLGNIAGGRASTVPGGSGNQATGDYSFAAGDSAQANNNGSFVWADTVGGPFPSTADNQFSVRAYGGVRFFTQNGNRNMTLDGYRVLTTVDGGGGGGGGSTNGWLLTGNNGADPAKGYFLGTTDTNALELRVQGFRALRLEPGGDPNQPSVIGGSWDNSVGSGVLGATIGGGLLNTNSANYSTIGGGGHNTGSGFFATVGGGWDNNGNGAYSTVSGGYGNTVNNSYATVGGGLGNTVNNSYGTVGGGQLNTAGSYATVPGGYNNSATGNGSFAAGRSAQTTYDGSFVWGDGTRTATGIGANQFDVLATGGVYLWTGSGGVWSDSARGFSLAAANEPLITRGYDPFGSGAPSAKAGLGRWGLFMEPFNLVLGIPGDDVTPRSFVVGKYDTNGNYIALTTVNQRGNLACNSLTILGGSDLAEPFQISTADTEVAQGAVLVIDEENPGHLRLSDQPYDTRVAGVVSGANGINAGIQMQQQGLLEGGKNVALTGRVYVQADASNGAIKPGDLLTSSASPGHAMRVSDHTKAQGAILGKAMTGLKEGKGMVLVLVTLQ